MPEKMTPTPEIPVQQNLADQIDEVLKSPKTKLSTTKPDYTDLKPLISSLTGLSEKDMHPTSAVKTNDYRGRLRNGEHADRHTPLCVLVLGKKLGKRALEGVKKFVDNDGLGHFTTIVLMCPGDTNYWQVSDILTDVSGRAVVEKIKGVYPDSHVVEVGNAESRRTTSGIDRPHQLITYGAPGTGKSYKIDMCTNESNSIRVTFHPDTDYAAFVGAYKPTMESTDKGLLTLEELKTVLQSLKDRGETRPEQKLGAEFWQSFEKLTPAEVKSILENESMYAEVMKGVAVGEYLTRIENGGKRVVYSFVPQAFMKAYVEAWRRYTNTGLQGDAKNYYLVIEEINRGNCAQIFGDLFQLLDRADNGFSAYAISPDNDIQKFLETDKDYKLADVSLSEDVKKVTETGEKIIATAADIKAGKKLVLPPNLYIWATMNTSDQSLFPIDSAFKRRWDWKYVPIREGKFKEDSKKGQRMAWKIKFTLPAHQENGQQVAAEDYTYDWWDFLKCVNALIFKTTESEDKKLGYFFVKPDGKSDPNAEDNDLISADRFVGKVIFYLWNDVFKDYGIETIFKVGDGDKKAEDEAKGVEFQAFFNEEDDHVNVNTLLAFFKHLELKSDEEKNAPAANAQNNNGGAQDNAPAQDGNGNPEA